MRGCRDTTGANTTKCPTLLHSMPLTAPINFYPDRLPDLGTGKDKPNENCDHSWKSQGDAVVFSHQLYHASFGGGVRRMFTLNFRARLPQSKEEQLAFTWEDVQARLLKAPSQSARL